MVLLSQYHDEVFGCKEASEVVTLRPHRRSYFVGAWSLLRLHHTAAMTAAMVTSVTVRPLRKPSPAREAKGAPGAAGKDASESEAPDIPPPPGGLAACKLEPLRQEAINLLTLDELVELFAHAHH